MTILEMAALAKEHWKAVNPEVYQLMKSRGDLEKEAIAAAKLTQREMDTLMQGGATEAEAWQESRSLFILTDPATDYNP
jgi:hypothetical protein